VRETTRVAWWVLPAALVAQAALLLPRLDLLPIWADEQFTLDAVQAPLAVMFDLLRLDLHPPLYFLILKVWTAWLPTPFELITEIRLASVGFLLATTVCVDRLWLRQARGHVRAVFLLLWVLSPCLLLYGRMGRSYTPQILLFVVAAELGMRWLTRTRLTAALSFAVGLAALLYVHYAPGLALAGAAMTTGAYRAARGERGRATSLAVLAVVTAVLYLPWASALAATLIGRIGVVAAPLAGGVLLDQAFRAGFLAWSFAFGETLPPAGVVAAGVIAPFVAWLFLEGRGSAPRCLPLVATSAAFAYLLTLGHVVSMTPSRLLFLLPFALLLVAHGCARRPRLGAVVAPALAAISLAGAMGYFGQRDFLNKGYLLPFDRIAADVVSGAGPGPALLVVDTSNIDATRLVRVLDPTVPAAILRDEQTLTAIAARLAAGEAGRVLFLRNTRDRSPGRWSDRLLADLERDARRTGRTAYVPYGWTDHLAMRLLGWRERPNHVLELIEFEPR
jgi:hypothetical protein